MKKTVILLLAVALLAGGGWWATTSYAASLPTPTPVPGTDGDPLVSKKYVDDKFDALQAQINQILARLNTGTTTATAAPSIVLPGTLPTADDSEIVSDVVAQIQYLYGDVLSGSTSAASAVAAPAPDSSFTPVSAAAGQIILGDEGTEIILRSGAAVGYTAVADGIVNASAGADIKNGQVIKTNQLHIVPRADGRGVRVTQDAWFMIKGSYQIVN